jgi:hypothetical protein
MVRGSASFLALGPDPPRLLMTESAGVDELTPWPPSADSRIV